MCVSVYVRMCVCELWYCFHKIKKPTHPHTLPPSQSFWCPPYACEKQKEKKYKIKAPLCGQDVCACVCAYTCMHAHLCFCTRVHAYRPK